MSASSAMTHSPNERFGLGSQVLFNRNPKLFKLRTSSKFLFLNFDMSDVLQTVLSSLQQVQGSLELLQRSIASIADRVDAVELALQTDRETFISLQSNQGQLAGSMTTLKATVQSLFAERDLMLSRHTSAIDLISKDVAKIFSQVAGMTKKSEDDGKQDALQPFGPSRTQDPPKASPSPSPEPALPEKKLDAPAAPAPSKPAGGKKNQRSRIPKSPV